MGKRVYRVKKGDNFIKISRKLYGNASYVMDLMRANPGFYRLGKGMVLRLPKEDPRVTRKRKIKRRMKDYVPPKEEETTIDWTESRTEKGNLHSPRIPSNWYDQSQTGDTGQISTGASLGVLDDPAFLDEVVNTIAETAAQMGLNEEVMLDELGMGEGSPLIAGESSTDENKPQTYSDQPTAESTTPPVSLPNEQIDTLKDELEKLGLDVDVAMEELGLGEGETSSTTTQTTSDGIGDGGEDDTKGGKVARPALPEEPQPPETPEDMVDLLETVESEEDLAQWRETLSTMNLRPEVMHGLEYMAEKKEKELQEASQTAGVSMGPLQPPPTPKPEGNSPEETMYYLLYHVENEEDLWAWKKLLSRMSFDEENMRRFLEQASIKEQEVSSKRQNPFWDTVILLSGYEDVILPSYQYQKDGTQTTPNDCTEAAMAMIMTMEMTKYDPTSKGIRFGILARDMDKQWQKFYRFSAGSPFPGVTPPIGAVKLLNDYGKSHEPGWTAELAPLSTTDDLLQNIMDGKPTMIYGVNLSGEKLPHAVVPVGYDTATKEWIILNPGTNPERNLKLYEVWSDKDLKDFWYGNRFEGIPIFGHNTMITLYPNP